MLELSRVARSRNRRPHLRASLVSFRKILHAPWIESRTRSKFGLRQCTRTFILRALTEPGFRSSYVRFSIQKAYRIFRRLAETGDAGGPILLPELDLRASVATCTGAVFAHIQQRPAHAPLAGGTPGTPESPGGSTCTGTQTHRGATCKWPKEDAAAKLLHNRSHCPEIGWCNQMGGAVVLALHGRLSRPTCRKHSPGVPEAPAR